jgi:hypothetical protein
MQLEEIKKILGTCVQKKFQEVEGAEGKRGLQEEESEGRVVV